MSAQVKETAAAEMTQQYLTFLLNGELFGLAIQNIREIIEYGQITQVPMVPSFVRGVINLRGAVVPVIDLSIRFGKQPSPITRKTCIVIAEMTNGDESECQIMGVVVDAVSEVLDIADSQIGAAPAFGTRIRSDFIQGMGKLDNKFVILLNMLHVLSIDEMAQLSSIDADMAMNLSKS